MTPSHPPVEVTQEDREVLKVIYVPATHEAIDAGDYDSHQDAQAIARLRLRLSAQPSLPDEVGDLVADLRYAAQFYGDHRIEEAADTIVALQAENDALKTQVRDLDREERWQRWRGDDHARSAQDLATRMARTDPAMPGSEVTRLQARVAALEEAQRRFLAKYDECEPHIDGALVMAFDRMGASYTGPQLGEEVESLRALLADPAEGGAGEGRRR